ncbi:MAG: AI-2E family transporter [Alphaproteobacteria bacterium]|nr:AI-2E family transporter [Alphaproteobacteria bacterium]
MEGTNLPTDQNLGAPGVTPEPGIPRGRRSFVGGWAIAAVLSVLAILLYQIRIALLPFVFAIAVAFVTDPLIGNLQRRLGCPRWPVAAGCYIAILTVLGVAGYWVGTTAAGDLIKIARQAPQILHDFLSMLIGSEGVTVFGQSYTPDTIVRASASVLEGAAGLDALKGAARLAGSLIFGTVLTLVLMPYFMISAPRLAAGAIWLLPPERRPSVEQLLPRIVPALRRYLIGLALVVFYTAVVGWVGFGPIFRLPHAVLLALIVGLLELVPAVGPFASGTIVGIIAVQQHGLWAVGLLFGFAMALRLSIDNIVGPLVLGEAARVHPVVIIASFVCGAILFGVVGLLIAVPIVVCVKITLQHYYAEPIAGQSISGNSN